MLRRLPALVLLLVGLALGAALAPRPALGGAFAPAPRDWVVVTKVNTETRTSNTTLTDDADLKFTAAANTNYRLRFSVYFRSPDAPDFKWALTGPSSPTLLSVRPTSCAAFGTPSTQRPFGQYSDLTASLTGAPASTVNQGGFVVLEGVLHNGSSAGPVVFQWAQNTSDAGSTSVLSGSWVESKVVQ